MAVADSENLREAARAAGKSTGALSLQIKALEEMAGQPLFERATRGKQTRLTDAGRLYYNRLKSTLHILSPTNIAQPPPTEIIELDLESDLPNAHPKIRQFWNSLTEIGFDLRKNRDKAYAIRNISLSFREKDGQWIHNHIGRRNDFADFKGAEFCRNVIGKSASYRQPSGLFDPYDWTVTKIYNKVANTGQPSLNRVIGWIDDFSGRKHHLTYDRIAVKVQAPEGDLILVRGVIRHSDDRQPIQKMGYHRLEMDKIDRAPEVLSSYYHAWTANRLWYSEELRPYHQYALLCRPLQHLAGALILAHLGIRHSATEFFGRHWRETAIGASLNDNDLWGETDDRMNSGYYETLHTGEPILDLITTGYRKYTGELRQIVYLRLLTRCFLRDGSPVICNINQLGADCATRAEAQARAEEIQAAFYD